LAEFTGERVIPGQVDADLLNEHLARYAFAARLSRRKQVLDAGCGAGYGSAELARSAAGVLGIDSSAEAIAHARAEYAAPNLRFEEGDCTRLSAVADGSIDLVVAFEVIEHLENWRGFLVEARRVLAPSGQFIVSTPNRLYYSETRKEAGPNPFHVHEFEFEEFGKALGEVFPHVSLFLENHAEGVVFQPASAVRFESSADVRVDDARCAPAESHFFVAVCASRPQTGAPTFVYVPRVANVLREREHHIGLLEVELETKNQWLEKTTAELGQLNADHQNVLGQFRNLIAESEAQNLWAEKLGRELEASGAEIVRLQQENESLRIAAETRIRELEAENEQSAKWALDAEARVKTETDEKVQCLELLQQAEHTVEERTAWAQRLQAEADQLAQQVNQMKESRWVKVGRKFGLGPDLSKS